MPKFFTFPTPSGEKPAFFHSQDYLEDWATDNAFSRVNVQHDIPLGIKGWIFDMLQLSISKIGDPVLVKKMQAALTTAREYDKSTENLDPLATVITQMYVCELLGKLLIYRFSPTPEDFFKNHGYYTMSNAPLDALDAKVKTKKDAGGIAFGLHDIFYSTALPHELEMMPVRTYLRYIPELRETVFDVTKESTLLFRAHHDDANFSPNETYTNVTHRVSISLDDGILSRFNLKSIWADVLPELASGIATGNPNGGNNGYNPSLQADGKSDNIISSTFDLDGRLYYMGFGGENTPPKQREVEIRWYLIFVLGSLARYYPEQWQEIRGSALHQYWIRRFLETNQVLYPLNVLRYITGRTFCWQSIARFG